MGAAKRRGTFEERKAQKLSKQFGLTNAELEEAYQVNRVYNMQPIYQSVPYQTMMRLVQAFKWRKMI